jgi:Phytanoyl-CoA dioxygenase (PhyH)
MGDISSYLETEAAGPLVASSPDEALARADELAAGGRCLDAIELLRGVRAMEGNPDVDRRLTAVRHQAFRELPANIEPQPPPQSPAASSAPAGTLVEIEPTELTASAVRQAIRGCGGLLVRGLVAGHVERLVDGIDAAFAARRLVESKRDGDDGGAWYHPLRLGQAEAQSLARRFVAGDNALLACDSPRFVNDLLDLYEQIGLRRLVTEYLQERPVLSANKCTLRHVRLESGTDWHQDGAFLGTGIRALNVWLALTDCGVDAPGLDLVPMRLDDVLPTGTGGAIFDWAVGPDVVDGLKDRAPVVRPALRAGDVMLFDELFLHRTAIDRSMTKRRYAIEAWFFAPSAYPAGQVPLVW